MRAVLSVVTLFLIAVTLQQATGQDDRMLFEKKLRPQHVRRCDHNCVNRHDPDGGFDYNFLASVFITMTHEPSVPIRISSGSRIGYRHILTAAYALTIPLPSGAHLHTPFSWYHWNRIWVVIHGSSHLHAVEHITIASTFNKNPSETNDYALIRLGKTDHHSALRLCLPPDKFRIPVDQNGNSVVRQMSYFNFNDRAFDIGETNVASRIAEVKVEDVEVELFSLRHCASAVSTWLNDRNVICAACTQHWKGPCVASSGGPVVYVADNGVRVQVGLTYFNTEVAKKDPAFYTYIKVDGKFRRWIIATVKAAGDDVCFGDIGAAS